MFKCKKCGKTADTNKEPCSRCNSKDFVEITSPQIDNKEKDDDYDDLEM